ncbi:MAG: MraY family glycosyltransferase [Bacillota bacterium]
MDNLFYFVVPLAISFVSTPLLSSIAKKNGITDNPGLHKTHHEPKPLLGGLSIFLAVVIGSLCLLPVTARLFSGLVGAAILAITGLLDDVYNLKPHYKMAGQAAAASVVVLYNREAYGVLVNYFERFYLPEALTLALIIGWIVLMVNAFNLIDGLDGLAIGTAVIIAGALTAVSVINGAGGRQLAVQLICLGAFLGFLPYNFNPARIFLGDTGSMLLGYLLASLHLFAITEPFSSSLVLGSAFIFAFPAVDVTYAICRRLKNRRSIFGADQGHIHHLLRRLGLSVRRAVLLLYAVSIFCAALAVFLLSAAVHPAYVLALGIIISLGFCWLILLLNRRLRSVETPGGSSPELRRTV